MHTGRPQVFDSIQIIQQLRYSAKGGGGGFTCVGEVRLSNRLTSVHAADERPPLNQQKTNTQTRVLSLALLAALKKSKEENN